MSSRAAPQLARPPRICPSNPLCCFSTTASCFFLSLLPLIVHNRDALQHQASNTATQAHAQAGRAATQVYRGSRNCGKTLDAATHAAHTEARCTGLPAPPAARSALSTASACCGAMPTSASPCRASASTPGTQGAPCSLGNESTLSRQGSRSSLDTLGSECTCAGGNRHV